MRLDSDTLAHLRESGPGWQTHAADILTRAVAEGADRGDALQRFEFPMVVSVELPNGKTQRGVGTVSVRAQDQEAAIRKMEADPRATRLLALLNVVWESSSVHDA
jgi:hypothetical protein